MENYSVFDAHCDTLCRILDRGGTFAENRYNADKRRMTEYRAYTQVFACFIAPEYHGDARARFEALRRCYNRQDFTGITPILSIEGGEMIDSVEYVEYLAACGVRCIALTWNGSNKLAGGIDDPDVGLTPFGRDVVRKMERLGILLDVSHMSDKSFYDAVRIAEKPIIATHSNSRAVCANPRNLTDDMFKIIRDTGGCAGINLYPEFVTGGSHCTVSDVVRHIDRFMELGGGNAVGIGADFDGTDDCLPDGVSGCEDLYKIFDEMKRLGYSDEQVGKISDGNFKRVFTEG